ncbi:PEP-CTERM sorting domain-containing protein [Alteromonas macleodii]|uniref:PEP-CTERM protein-sorting domain protein n=1 Tax=Alteromonas macleodii TaxID=28108 RepID=A0AB36FMT7_ALTMA|nr:PEP-CTERM sorting domain-containing protein [Alteromonas macleodii]OES24397.1 PEP-CTERM protein-sorting domain protein [Alteromonas macleodii]OES25349.1 PEP-CTERM protein-sorting domain protein [Alteromonas macleodii]OES25448.1 PEP-CTERM protein-sorting domain protein [Alteromonas macleodii]OES38803.1 PEP-CTERM protein-sorting domain protein [Alteromonas macleodii]
MKHILTTLLLLLISKATYADIIKYEYSLNYIGYEYYGVNYLDESQIASELDDLNTNPIEVSFTYDDTLMYYSYWLDGENRVGQFGGGDDTLWSRSGPSRGDDYFDFTAFNISRVHSLLEGLIVRMPEITTTNYLSGSSAYTLTNPSVDLFTIERDYYSFSLEDSTSQQTSRVIFYLNESSQLAVDFESSLVSRTATPSQSNISVPEPQTGIILAMGAMLLLLRRCR